MENIQCNIEDFTINCENNQRTKFYQCNICGTSLLSKKSFTKHYNSVHAKNQKAVRESLAKKNLLSHKCEICEKLFHSEINLRSHKIWHREWKYECDICHLMFPSQGFVNSHRSQIHFPKPRNCRWHCGQTFKQPSERLLHEKRIHYQTKYSDVSCDICGKSISSKWPGLLKRHKKTHLNPSERTEEYKCSKCFEVFQSRDKVKQHRKLVHYNAKYRCFECDKLFIFERNLKIHIEKMKNKKHIKKAHKCESCHKSFFNTQNLKIHIGHSHKDYKMYKCVTCNKSFFKAQRLKLHIHTDHEGNTASKCESCGKLFLNESSMKRHIKMVHEGNALCQTYKCEKCNKTFSLSKSLKIHMSTDHGGNYKCDLCAQSFSTEMGLRVHFSHTHREKYKAKKRSRNKLEHGNYQQEVQKSKRKSDKMYKCDKCKKEFLTKGYLTKHIENVHEGLKRFKCDPCGESFSQSGELRRHMAIMHDGKKFKCEFENCSKEYASRGELKYHIRSTHGYTLQCNHCDRKYLDTHELNLHNLKDHENEKIKCESCHKYYSKIYIYQYHNKTIYEEGKSKFKCKSCSIQGRSFNSHVGQIRHEKIHHYLNKPLERICDICGKPCSTEIGLKNHKNTHLNPLERIEEYSCSICSKTFPTAKQCTEHRKSVHNTAKFECPKCNKKFVKEKNMQVHVEKHKLPKKNRNENSYSCYQCSSDQKYSISSLRRHLKSKHSAVYKCKEDGCEKSFLYEKQFNAHMRNHQNRKCHLCSYVSTAKGSNGPQYARIHLIMVHKLTIEDLLLLGRYDPKIKEGKDIWLKRYVLLNNR